MKYAIIIGDGMADEPLEGLGGRTPLEVADIPNMREIARKGQTGLVRTIPRGMPPGSDVATMSVLGYDPKKYYSGRAPLEAARLGIELGPEEVAFRCNLITIEDDSIADYAGGHITTEEARELVDSLSRQMSRPGVRFYAGVGYRHICVVKGEGMARVDCTPPHDVIGQPVKDHLPRGDGARLLIDLMEGSRGLLQSHEVNKARLRRGLRPANMIWLWGQGVTPRMPNFRDRFGIEGSVISAVDLLNGIARLVGLNVIDVPGATGYYDTNYEGKGAYAIRSLESRDFVLVHVEAPDEAGHNGDIEQKIRAMENLDRLVVGPIMRKLGETPRSRLMVLPDHPTPIRVRTHTDDPVPFAWCGHGIPASGVPDFSERAAASSGLRVEEGHTLMGRLTGAEKLVE
ncbi:MAG: cofactor-independent phosphoglycerate mutase [Dehalococcoidia bacterium]|nr:cofactor-independent phosphoglycerate mutase [Dehalococcoidia bacterium]